jgi:hypothetical protein
MVHLLKTYQVCKPTIHYSVYFGRLNFAGKFQQIDLFSNLLANLLFHSRIEYCIVFNQKSAHSIFHLIGTSTSATMLYSVPAQKSKFGRLFLCDEKILGISIKKNCHGIVNQVSRSSLFRVPSDLAV